MRSRLTVIAGLILVLAVSLALVVDDEPLKVILSKLGKFRTAYPQEKVHLHFDKPYYSIGETIWFKAYVVNAEHNQLSGLSKVLYVDLINEADSVTQSLCLPLTAGLTWGDFQLPGTLQEGNYRVRAYTNYMRNFGDEYFFDKAILIGNVLSNNIITAVNYRFETQGTIQRVNATVNYSDIDGRAVVGKEVTYNVQLNHRNIAKGKAITDNKGDIDITFLNKQSLPLEPGRINTILRMDEQRSVKKSFPVKSISNKTSVQFFPEGGNQVYGIRSKVAFKAVGADGLGKDITGYVSNSSGEKLLEFRSEHAGMGFFTLQPIAGQTYTATVKFPDGSEKTVALPQPLEEGFILGVGNLDSTNLMIRINASPAMVASGGQVTLVAQSNSVMKFVSQSKLDKPLFSAYIPKSRFFTGILQLTLFDQQNQPVAERLVFINHNDFLKVAVNGPKTSAPRKKVKMDIDVRDPSGKPVLGSFSVSVTDETKVPVEEIKESTIISNLLLSSDIRGYIEQPNYYFTNTGEQKVREPDNLMLTQGWRRFTWKNLLADNFPALSYKVEDGITISGRITQNKKPVAGGKVTLLSSQGGMFVIDTLTNAEGRFVFKNLIFPDSTRFVIQARTAKDNKLVDIELDSISPQLVTKGKNTSEVRININKELAPYLKNSRNQFEALRRYGMLDKSIMLSEVKIEGRITGRQEKTVDGSTNLAGRADAIITADQIENCVSLIDCLQGKVAGLVIQDGMPYLARSMYSSLTSLIPMMIIFDGVRINDLDAFSMINPSDVKAIEILKGQTAAIYGMLGGGGVMVITSKTGEGEIGYNSYTPGVITYSPKAYYKAREFYMPNYKDTKTNKEIPDLRTTIYWKPNVAVKNGKGSFEFFNADGKGSCRVTIEGIDAEGKLARFVYRYMVN